MAHLHRLIFAALVLLSVWMPSSSYASFPATPPPVTYRAQSCLYSSNSFFGSYASPQAACQASAYQYAGNAGNVVTYSVSGSGPYVCTWSQSAAATCSSTKTYTIPSAATGSYVCPANSTLSGSTCTCNSGWSQSGSTCIDPNIDKCAAAKNGFDLFSGFSSLPTVGASFCPADGAASSCAAKVSGGFCTIKAGVKKCTYEVAYTGGTCVPPAPSPTESPVPTPCKGTYGQVNGVDVCLPLGTDPSVTVETGKKTETTTTSSGGGPTTESTTEKATCIGSQCTTEKTTVTTTPDGVSTTKTETKSESKDDFCKTNPRSPQCLTSSWGGSCSASFSCDGDAIMCAITREQHTRNCKLFDDMSSTEVQLYNSEKGKAGEQTSTLPGSASVQISSANFDTSDAIGAGSGCIADKSVTVAGSVISIPFSTVCGHLAMLGNILLAVSFLLAGRILVRG